MIKVNMDQEIRRLNDQSVSSSIRGVAKNVFVLTSLNENKLLLEYSLEFVKYLILQGYQPEDVLVFVSNQRDRLAILEGVRVKFQVMLIGDVAFKSMEKVPKVVLMNFGFGSKSEFVSQDLFEALDWAVSVANGMYLLGNVDTLLLDNQTAEVYLALVNQGLVGDGLKLKCPLHGNEYTARSSSYFTDRRRCIEPCESVLPCGHPCRELCHLEDQEHQEKFACRRPCEKICKNGHICTHLCHHPCEPCQEEITKQFPCGHSVRLVCHEDNSSTCTNFPRAVFTSCGHPRKGRSCNGKPVCRDRSHRTSENHNKNQRLMDERTKIVRLACGHRLTVKISEWRNWRKIQLPCKEMCRKLCSMGHECVKHPCGEECPPCEQPLEAFYSLHCSHTYKYPCHTNNPSENRRKPCPFPCSSKKRCTHPCPAICGDHVDGKCPPCEEMTKTKRKCGHEWEHPCKVTESSEPCQVLVDVTSKATCGHNLQVPCSKVDEIYEGEMSLMCKATCWAYLDLKDGGCGHFCEEKCGTCLVTGMHGPCKHRCEKQLLCGHRCDSYCGVLCPPCQKSCGTKCEHGGCKNVCGLPCCPCQEPCSYGCEHGKCTARCSEPCNKPPCTQHCPKKLNCGHSCAGFCGEPCPPMCFICNRDELQDSDILGKNELTSQDRLILLVDCGHTIDSEALEQLMNTEKVNGQIIAKQCPSCRTEIQSCLRFKSQLLKIRADQTQVKELVVGTEQDIRLAFDEACDYVEKEYYEGLITPYSEVATRIMEELEKLNPDAETFDISKEWLGKARNVLTVARVYRKAVDMFEMSRHIPENLQKRLCWVLDAIMEAIIYRKWPMTDFQLKIVLNEWDRAVAMDLLYGKWKDDQPVVAQRLLRLPKGTEAFEKARDILDVIGPYDASAREKFAKAFEELEVAIEAKLGISDSERLEILQAFDFSMGRWFKCPNGHIYVVTECGGVTEEATCNECGALVGGTNHSVLPTNDLATEMDGAIEPLYPTALQRE